MIEMYDERERERERQGYPCDDDDDDDDFLLRYDIKLKKQIHFTKHTKCKRK